MPDGNYEMMVRFMTESSGGTSVYTETKTVTVEDGLFDVDIDDFPPHIFTKDINDNINTSETEDTLFMEVMIDGETLSPRRKVPGAAFAHGLVAGSGVIGPRPDAANVTDGGYESALTVINTQPAAGNPGYGLKAISGNAGLYADNLAGDESGDESPEPEDNPDIILGGEYATDSSGNTDTDTFGGPGVIASDPQLSGSDVNVRSNDEIWLYKDWDNNDGSEFRVYDNGTDDQQLVLDNSGNLTVDGTVSGGGADYAELIDAEGGEAGYEPGDVLVISNAIVRSSVRPLHSQTASSVSIRRSRACSAAPAHLKSRLLAGQRPQKQPASKIHSR